MRNYKHRREFDYVFVAQALFYGRRCKLGRTFDSGNVMFILEDGSDLTGPRRLVNRSDSYAAIRAVRGRGNG